MNNQTSGATMLDHLNMTVHDLDQSAEWYGRIFGFETVEHGLYQGHRWAILKAGEAMLCMYEHPELRALQDGPAHRVSHFGLRIEDRDRWETLVQREQLETLYGGAVQWPHSTSWYVRDPSGWEIEVALWNQDHAAFG